MAILDAERRQQIVALVEGSNGMTVVELSRHFGVSAATIRRDLVQLSGRGLIERAHGGAARRIRGGIGFPEPPLLKRASLQADEKRRIGAAAAAHVEDGDTIIVSSGTTTAEMIPHLSSRKELTVLTNALNIAMLLASSPSITVVVFGGILRHSELNMVGTLVEDALENLRADKLFMGSPAIHVDYGFSAQNLAEARNDQVLMGAAREVTVLADHTKFGKVAMARVAPIKRVRRIITTAAVSSDDVDGLRDQGVLVEIV